MFLLIARAAPYLTNEMAPALTSPFNARHLISEQQKPAASYDTT